MPGGSDGPRLGEAGADGGGQRRPPAEVALLQAGVGRDDRPPPTELLAPALVAGLGNGAQALDDQRRRFQRGRRPRQQPAGELPDLVAGEDHGREALRDVQTGVL